MLAPLAGSQKRVRAMQFLGKQQ